MNLFHSHTGEVESAYIITVKDHAKSEQHSKECAKSCEAVGMPYKIWDAFDGTAGTIIPPEKFKDDSIIDILKITDHYLTRGEVACALSHISLWIHCARIQKPIVILEHDAIMVRKFPFFNSFNAICYLGGREWVMDKWPVHPVPPHATEGPNYNFICRAHAYALDPIMAKNLIAHVIKMGICAPLDIMIRADLFNITHQGIYAFDKNYDKTNDTTIKNRPVEGRTTARNDRLLT